MDPNIVEYWLNQDPRRVRPAEYTSIYPLDVETITKKTQCLLPKKVIEGKKILDLGAGIPYIEIWCNQNNAHYTGVEIQRETAIKSAQLISKNNDFFHDSIENFLDNADLNNYDVIVCSSTLHLVSDFTKYFIKILKSKKTVVIEESIKDRTDASLSVRENVAQYTDDPTKSIKVQKFHATSDFLRYYFKKFGYEVNDQYYNISKKILPQWFGTKKYFLHATFNNDSQKILTMQENEWSFNKQIADIFEDHAEKHIPDYDYIIKSLPNILRNYGIEQSDPILDFGCATGKTLRVLRYAGFKNLTGIDSSREMLDKVPYGLADLICNNHVKNKKFKVIISNWTLHFNNNKWQILQHIKENLLDGGLVILSEKTQDVDLALYHAWKKNNNLSEEEIKIKHDSLKNKMFLDKVKSYEEKFKQLGFKYFIFNNKLNFVTWILK